MISRPFVIAAVVCSLCVVSAGRAPVYAGAPKKSAAAPSDTVHQAGYRIDQPGTITFTVGMVIKGKVEKPQVMIFLPKEKTFFREQRFSHSFREELAEPLPFTPILE